MTQDGETWEDVDVRLNDMSLRISGDDAPASTPEDPDADAVPRMPEEAPRPNLLARDVEVAMQSVDHALRDALCHPKNRVVVLQLEADVSWFVSNSREPQFVFTGDMSSYERLLAHRVAQHWGLETTIISQGPDQGRILASRSHHTGDPLIKLFDVPVAQGEAPGFAGPNGGMPGGSAGSPGITGGPAPRVLVRRRSDRMHPRHLQDGGGGGGPGGAGHPGNPNHVQFASNEDREAVYAQARARIFSDAYAAGQGAGAGGARVPDVGRQPPPPPPPPPPPAAQQTASPGGPSGSGSPAQQPYGAAGGRKAQLRNKQEDMADPDFRRGRHSPRFDYQAGAYTGDEVQSMYLRPTYSSEFPELVPKMDGTPHASPQGLQPMPGMYPGSYPGQMVAISPYHMYAGQGMMPMGMVAAHMPGGGMAMYPAGSPIPYGTSGTGPAYMPMPHYGYVPMRPGGDQAHMMAYPGAMPMYGGYGAPMPPMAHHGGGGLQPLSRRGSVEGRPQRGGGNRARGHGLRGGGGGGGAGNQNSSATSGSQGCPTPGAVGVGGVGGPGSASAGSVTEFSASSSTPPAGVDAATAAAVEGMGEHSPRAPRTSPDSVPQPASGDPISSPEGVAPAGANSCIPVADATVA